MTHVVRVAVVLGSETVEAGIAYFTRRHNATSTSFRYHEEYLSRRDAYPIDPAMPLFSGAHQSETTGRLPGLLARQMG